MSARHLLRNSVLLTIVALMALAAVPVIYFAVLNSVGPSTQYLDPRIEGAQIGPDGNYYATVGDKIYVTYTVVRHRFNGKCLLNVWRYAEDVGGPQDGQRHLVDYVDLQFRGNNDVLRPRWPLAGLVLGYDTDRQGRPQFNKPLLPPGVAEQAFDLYVVARYRCNFMDYIVPRYLQGGKPDETRRVRIIVKRKAHE